MARWGRARLVDWLLQHDLKHMLLRLALLLSFGTWIEEIEPMRSGTHRRVYSGIWNGQSVIMLIAPDLRAFYTEQAAYTLLQASGLPVSRLLFSDARPRWLYLSTTILSRLPGTSLESVVVPEAQRLRLYREAGALLQRLHTIRVRAVGPLCLRDGEYRGMYASWHDYWTDLRIVETCLEYLQQRDVLRDADLALLREAGVRVRNAQFGQSVLLHGDYHAVNLLTDGQHITGIIDLADALAGDPRYDVGTSLAFFSAEEQAAFREGYGPLADDPLVACYTALAAAYRFAWAGLTIGQQTRGSSAHAQRAPAMLRALHEALADLRSAPAQRITGARA
ncbi:MAG TPA: aminoglycoside phosphotransferase family protein [Chloroflexota bacterium]|nr:aminoglycoside phosphotransferase family protein [Chloroflexota bacterium]